MEYSVYMLCSNGLGHYLSIKGRVEWKTKAIAIKHAQATLPACKSGFGRYKGGEVVEVSVLDTYGDEVKSWRIL